LKRIITFALCFSFLFLTVGCALSNDTVTDGTEPEQTVPEPSTSNTNSPSEPPDDGENSIYLAYLETYVLSDSADDSLKTLYQSSQSIEVFPIFFNYFEKTDLLVFLFHKDGEIIGGEILTLEESNDPENTSRLAKAPETVNGYQLSPRYDNKETYINRVELCRSMCPDFRIIALEFDWHGTPEVLPVGYYQEETTIKFWRFDPVEYWRVDPFSTLEEGFRLYENYRQTRAGILSKIPIFSWKNDYSPYSEFGYDGCYFFCGNIALDPNISTEEHEQLSACNQFKDDSFIIPLLSSELEENVYMLHLFYYHNELIGEIVLRRVKHDVYDGDEYWYSDFTYVCEWKNIAEKDENGNYIPITEIKYQKVVEAAQEANPDHEICGVIFENGKFVPYYLDGDAVVRCVVQQ